MDKLFDVLKVVLPVIVILLCGALVRKRKIMSQEGMDQLKSLLVKICLPCLLLGTFYKMSFTGREAAAFFTMSGTTLVTFLLGLVVCRLLKIRQRTAPWMCTTIEGDSVGYALFILLFGQENLYHLGLLDAGNALIQWTLVITMLALSGGEKKSPREIVKSLVNPVNISILLGVALSASGIGPRLAATKAGETLNSVLDFVGSPVSALIMLSVGYGLSFRNMNWKEMLQSAGARAAISAVIGVIVCVILKKLFPEDPMYFGAGLIFFICPPTYVYTMYARNEEENAYVSGFLAFYTLLTVAAFIVVAAMIV